MEMIKKLRRRLVGVSMLSLLLVLLSILGAASLLNYRKVVQDADSILDQLEENGGSFPELRFAGGTSSQTPETPPEQPDAATPEDAAPAEPESALSAGRTDGRTARRNGRRGRLSAETPFESRFFTVTFLADGSSEVETGRIAAVDEEEALSYAQKVLSRGKSRGFLDSYRYRTVITEEESMVIFLDCGRTLSVFQSSMLTSFGISALGLLVVFALIRFFSGRIIRPFVENYEKQRRFITDAGHELKTPLAIIEADADVLEMDLGEDNEWLQDIQKQTQRLAGLTRNLISLARMEESSPQITMIDFPVSEVVVEAAESYRAPAIAQGKTFALTAEPLLTLCGDEASLRQLVGILLDNALKYSDEHGSISLTLSRQGKNLLLQVSNTAEHVSRESTAHLFERFYRADASRSTGGYGIGLSIARAIVTAHKGRIQASTKDERSLDITVQLPGCRAAEAEQPDGNA